MKDLEVKNALPVFQKTMVKFYKLIEKCFSVNMILFRKILLTKCHNRLALRSTGLYPDNNFNSNKLLNPMPISSWNSNSMKNKDNSSPRDCLRMKVRNLQERKNIRDEPLLTILILIINIKNWRVMESPLRAQDSSTLNNNIAKELVWRRNAPYFYQTLYTQELDWPSLTV